MSDQWRNSNYVCDWCGKEFWTGSIEQYAWKQRARVGREKSIPKTYLFCRYDHMRAWQRANGKLNE